MASVYGTLNVNLRDFRGFTGRVALTIQSPVSEADLATRAAAVLVDLVGSTNAAVIHTTGIIVSNNPSAYGASAGYADIGHKMVLELHTVDGTATRLAIPSPTLSCFDTDGVTYKATGNANLDSLITAIGNGTIVQATTLLPQVFDMGFYSDRRRKRRIGKKTLNPSGTGPA